jgi:hypothetical protein
MDAHRILFGIGLLTDEPKDLFGVGACFTSTCG